MCEQFRSIGRRVNAPLVELPATGGKKTLVDTPWTLEGDHCSMRWWRQPSRCQRGARWHGLVLLGRSWPGHQGSGGAGQRGIARQYCLVAQAGGTSERCGIGQCCLAAWVGTNAGRYGIGQTSATRDMAVLNNALWWLGPVAMQEEVASAHDTWQLRLIGTCVDVVSVEQLATTGNTVLANTP